MRCCGCKRAIPATESCWRDMSKRHVCNDCYRPQVVTIAVVKK